jgi:hypothetical protein
MLCTKYLYKDFFLIEKCFFCLVLHWVWYLITPIKIKYTIQALA